MRDVTDVVIDWVRSECLETSDNQRVSPDMPLVDGLGLDSLQIANMIAFMESEFAISFDVEDLVEEHFETIETVASMIQRCRDRAAN